METVRSWTAQDLERLDGIIVEGERRFKERQPRCFGLPLWRFSNLDTESTTFGAFARALGR